MKINEIKRLIGNIPHMNISQAKIIREFIHENDIKNILELGFQHGVSTCYMAAILDELGRGKITTIDLEKVRVENPNIESLLEKCGLRKYVNVFYEPTSYTWLLMKMIEKDQAPMFDLCYLDGAHSWFVDGFAFFLVDRLLQPGGWIIFDDINWTYASSPALKNTDWVKAMPSEEREIPQVRKVYDLLVKTHPSYGDFRIENDWIYAHKLLETSSLNISGKRQIVVQKEIQEVGLGATLIKILKKMKSQ